MDLKELQSYASLDKRIALIEQQIHLIKTNHLAHIEEDIKGIHSKFNWAVGVLFTQLMAIISYMAFFK
jgi:hypothetical protein